MRQQFDTFTKSYFTGRQNLAMVLMLVDSSVPPQQVGRGATEGTTSVEGHRGSHTSHAPPECVPLLTRTATGVTGA